MNLPGQCLLVRMRTQTGACTVSEATFRPVGENTSGSGTFSVMCMRLVFQAVMFQSRKLTRLHFQETRFGGN